MSWNTPSTWPVSTSPESHKYTTQLEMPLVRIHPEIQKASDDTKGAYRRIWPDWINWKPMDVFVPDGVPFGQSEFGNNNPGWFY